MKNNLSAFYFQSIVLSMKKKHYSFLDQRRTDFDQDYDEFCKNTTDLHVSLHLITNLPVNHNTTYLNNLIIYLHNCLYVHLLSESAEDLHG